MIAVWVVVGVVVVIALFGVYLYNRLVRLRLRTANAWSQIEVQLRRRHDLIPNLIEAVKGYAAHEREVFEEVARTRAVAQQASGVASQAAAEQQVTQSVHKLIAVAENYPQLKANQNFLALQEELTGTEDKIAYARQFYNDQVQRYNTLIQAFPSSMVAGMGNFQPREFFDVDEPTRGPVEVQF